VRLVVLDLDGTVLPRSGRVSRATREVLAEVRRAGALVAIATGRAPAAARYFARLLGADGPLICLDGALALHGGRTLWERPLDPAVARAVAAAADAAGGGWIALTRDGRVHGGPCPRPPQASWRRVLRHPLRSWRFYRTVRHERVRRAARPPEEPVYKLLVWAAGEAGRAALEAAVRALPVRVPSPPGHTMEVVAPDVNKGRALEVVAAHLGIAARDVVAFGDGLNDLEMLAFAGYGVAMAGAPEPVRRVARAEAPSVDEDGVALELARLLGRPRPARRRAAARTRGSHPFD
jgi:hydroxymethylpyrimidine pyrophosphatase-like HAD family hydrolase